MNSAAPDGPLVELLIVEDNPGDVRLLTEALAASLTTRFRAHVAHDVDSALAWVRAKENALPHLVLLDLDLGGRDGTLVLRALKADEQLRPTPVIVLSGARKSASQINAVYREHAACFLEKPADLPGFERLAAALGRFWFGAARLPRTGELHGRNAGAEGKDAVLPDQPAARLDLTLAGVTVLFVDDDADTRELTTEALAMRGAQVTPAANVASALALLETKEFRVLVSDIAMPAVDGYALIREVRARLGSQLPAIALSAYGGDEHRKRALEAGFSDYIAKPTELDALVRLLERWTR